MATAGDLRDHIKADLVINGTDYDAQILNAIHSALRQLRGRRFWFLQASDTLTTTANQEYVALPDDFAAPRSFDLIYGGSRLSDAAGFDFLEYDRLKREHWTTSPLMTGIPQACAIYGGSLWLSCYAASAYSIPMTYYKKDTTLPAAASTSVWFDDGYDVVRTLAQAIFKRDAQGFAPSEEDGSLYQSALARLGETHTSYMDGGR